MHNVNINKILLMLFPAYQNNPAKLEKTIAQVKEKNERYQQHWL